MKSKIECPHPLEHLELTGWKEVHCKENRIGLQSVIFCWACEQILDFYFERPKVAEETFAR
jgi:hypothetical protein